MIYPITSPAEQTKALDYLNHRLAGTAGYKRMTPGVLQNESARVFIVGSPGLPANQDYRWGYLGRRSVAVDWLVSEIVAYCGASDTAMVLIEDFRSRVTDPRFKEGAVGPAWIYKDHVIWPITRAIASNATVEQALRWGLIGLPEAVVLCGVPDSVVDLATDLTIDDSIAQQLSASATRLVTDVFDQECFLVWAREPKKQKQTA